MVSGIDLVQILVFLVCALPWVYAAARLAGKAWFKSKYEEVKHYG